jgi:hypothetical protein
MVGLAGFEPTTSCTPCKRTTKLCYSPKTHRESRALALEAANAECKCRL